MTDRPKGLAGYLLGTAVARWPAELREDLSLEWAAEIMAVRREAGVSRIARWWRSSRFALSLAVARPVEPAGEQPRGWREHLIGAHRAAAGVVALLLVPVAAFALAESARMPVMIFGTVLPAPADQISGSLSALACLLLAVLAGRWLARRCPLIPVTDWPYRAVACAVGTAVVLAAGLLVLDQLPSVGETLQDASGGWFEVAGGTVAVAAVALLASPAARRLIGGRRWRVVVAAMVGGFVAADIGVAVAGLPTILDRGYPPASLFAWLPMDLFGNSMEALTMADEAGPSAANPWLPFMALYSLPKTMLFTTAFGVSYAARLQTLSGEPLARPVPQTSAVPQLAREPQPVAGPASAVGVAAGASAALVGVVTWAVAAAGMLTGPPAEANDPGYFVAYGPDLRFAAIVLAGLGLAVAAVHVGSVVTPVILLMSTLLSVDVLLDGGELVGFRYAAAAAVLGTVIGCLALRLSPLLGEPPPAGPHRRARLTGLAVLAAFSAPAVPGHGELGFAVPRPPTMVWVAALLVSACLVLVAGVCAVAARPVAPRGAGRARLGAVIVVLAAVVALASTNSYGYLLGPVLGVGVLAVVRFAGRRARSIASWLGLGALAIVAGAPAWLLTDTVGTLLHLPLVAASGPPEVAGSVSGVLGAPVMGLLFILLFGRRRAGAAEAGTGNAAVRARMP